jgi:hypothetical protein
MGRLRVTGRHDAFGEPVIQQQAFGALNCNVPGDSAGADLLFTRIGERRRLGSIGNKELSGGRGNRCICDNSITRSQG